MTKPLYCTCPGVADCAECSLSSYGRDCQNEPIETPALSVAAIQDMAKEALDHWSFEFEESGDLKRGLEMLIADGSLAEANAGMISNDRDWLMLELVALFVACPKPQELMDLL